MADSAVRPSPLRPGDTVAVLSASGPPAAARLQEGLAVLQEWGLKVDLLPSATAQAQPFDYLAGPDEVRAADTTAALTEDRYAAAFYARGGYGAQRTLELLDWAAIAAVGARPRHVIGFSDVTALSEGVLRHLGWASLYAAMPATWYFTQDRARRSLHAQLFTPGEATRITFPDADPLVPGVARGRVLGGCATLLSSSIGSNTAVRPDGDLVFLEDVDEDLFRLDRVFTQLRRSGYLEGATGIITGTFDGCGEPALVRRLLQDRFADLGVPVLAGADVGHGIALQALPIGVVATLDTHDGSLTMERA
ncbi:S66 peptidase family protein [Dermacoccaceae bacterium W4C1]